MPAQIWKTRVANEFMVVQMDSIMMQTMVEPGFEGGGGIQKEQYI